MACWVLLVDSGSWREGTNWDDRERVACGVKRERTGGREWLACPDQRIRLENEKKRREHLVLYYWLSSR